MERNFVPEADLILDARRLGKRFTLHEQGKIVPAAMDVNIRARRGKLTALVGPSGAGKSSMLKAIYRTYIPTAGEVLYRTSSGQMIDLAQAEETRMVELRRTEIGFVTQFLRCLPRQSTLDVAARPLVEAGEEREAARRRAGEFLGRAGLPAHLWDVSPATFSGGERQRVNIARSFAARPRLLLLDEPTASLDFASRERVIGLIEEAKSEGAAMVAVFHDLDLVDRLADETVEISAPLSEAI